jgi:hypothetical protein
MVNGLIALPHVVKLWTATANEIDHVTAVLSASAAAFLISYKFPNLSEKLWRLQYLQSKGRSQLSEQELVEADNFEKKFDRFWGIAKTAILVNSLVFAGYTLELAGIR